MAAGPLPAPRLSTALLQAVSGAPGGSPASETLILGMYICEMGQSDFAHVAT